MQGYFRRAYLTPALEFLADAACSARATIARASSGLSRRRIRRTAPGLRAQGQWRRTTNRTITACRTINRTITPHWTISRTITPHWTISRTHQRHPPGNRALPQLVRTWVQALWDLGPEGHMASTSREACNSDQGGIRPSILTWEVRQLQCVLQTLSCEATFFGTDPGVAEAGRSEFAAWLDCACEEAGRRWPTWPSTWNGLGHVTNGLTSRPRMTPVPPRSATACCAPAARSCGATAWTSRDGSRKHAWCHQITV